MSLDLDSFLKERDAALRTLDMRYANKVMPSASSDFVRLIAMHKARYECLSIEAELREASRQWLPCLIVRNSIGSLCGYVGVSYGHPFFEKDYNDCAIEVHGGLTFADRCSPDGKICHLVEDDEDDNVWWLGFDCAHSRDVCPGHLSLIQFPGASYRDIAYVKAECLSLAKQLMELEATRLPRRVL